MRSICSVLLVVSIYVLISRPKIELVEFLFVALHLFILYACLRAFSGVCVCVGGACVCARAKLGKSCLSPTVWVLGNQAQIITNGARAILLSCL